jgi:hypothetical protein
MYTKTKLNLIFNIQGIVKLMFFGNLPSFFSNWPNLHVFQVRLKQ